MTIEGSDMDPTALATCAAALRLSEPEVLELRERADLLPALLARLVLGVEGRSLDDAAPDPAAAFLQAVRTGWGETFTARQVVDWCAEPISPDRRSALLAARLLCRLPDGEDLDPVRLGLALRRLAQAGVAGGLQLVAGGDARGATVWRVRGLRG